MPMKIIISELRLMKEKIAFNFLKIIDNFVFIFFFKCNIVNFNEHFDSSALIYLNLAHYGFITINNKLYFVPLFCNISKKTKANLE